MPAGQYEFERAGAGLTEERDAVIRESSGVLLHVVHHLVDELRVVQAAEDLFNHGLLIGREEPADFNRRDEPVVIDLRTQRIIERKDNLRLLLRCERFVESGGKGFRGAGNLTRKRRSQCGACCAECGGFEETAAIRRAGRSHVPGLLTLSKVRTRAELLLFASVYTCSGP